MKKSALGKIWQRSEVCDRKLLEFTQKLCISDFLAKIVLERTNEIDEATDYIFPKLKNLLPDPFHLLDMDIAVSRTIKSILNKQRICIFADYDVDGATSSALLTRVFRALGITVEIYIPDRLIEGYGPSSGAMNKLAANGTNLIITVDCGAMAHEAIKSANGLGMDVIVIDHHITTELLPEACAIVNPNRLDEQSQYGNIAAVGVAFLFAIALVQKLKKQNYFKDESSVPNLIEYLDLVALGTVCDVMPITGLNRAFVAQGLKVMGMRNNMGINALLDNALLTEKPSCYHLGFKLGPLINAGGRVGKSYLGAKLLSTTCKIEAKKLAEELETFNNERKAIELLMLEEAIEIAEQQLDKSFLFISRAGWHSGVIGIVAGRLKEKYNKPVAVVAINDGIGKASCRSIKNIDFGNKIVEAMHAGLLVAGGGHAMAAGFTVEESKLKELEEFLELRFAKDISKLEHNAYCEYTCDLTGASLTVELMQELATLEPFGNANPEPLFKISNLFVLKADLLAQKHIKCLFSGNRNSYSHKAVNAIGFNIAGTPLQDILLSQTSYNISVIGSLKLNVWQNRETVQLQIKDVIVEDSI